MAMIQREFAVATSGRGTIDVTTRVQTIVDESGIATGLCHLFLRHTSASLILCENADPAVRRDLELFMSRSVPDGDPDFEHTAEGPDDMPAHVRTVLTHNSFGVPIVQGRLGLGTWQGIYLWEHRRAGHQRLIVITLQDGNRT